MFDSRSNGKSSSLVNDPFVNRSTLSLQYEAENLEKAIINNDKYTVRRIIDLHQHQFNLVKDRSSLGPSQLGFPSHPLSTSQPAGSAGSPSLTSNTDLLEAVSKQALVSNDTDELPSLSSPEHTTSMFDAASSVLTYTTGPLAAALINHHQQHTLPSQPSSLLIGSLLNERPDTEHDSMFTAATSLYRESIYPASDSPNDAAPIFRNVLHVAIMYGKRSRTARLDLRMSFVIVVIHGELTVVVDV